jgi:hypothetical protein
MGWLRRVSARCRASTLLRCAPSPTSIAPRGRTFHIFLSCVMLGMPCNTTRGRGPAFGASMSSSQQPGRLCRVQTKLQTKRAQYPEFLIEYTRDFAHIHNNKVHFASINGLRVPWQKNRSARVHRTRTSPNARVAWSNIHTKLALLATAVP